MQLFPSEIGPLLVYSRLMCIITGFPHTSPARPKFDTDHLYIDLSQCNVAII